MKKFILLWVACMSCTHAFAWNLQSTNQYQYRIGGGGYTDNAFVDNVYVNSGDTVIVSETFSGSFGTPVIDGHIPTELYNSVIDNTANGGGTLGFRVYAYTSPTTGSLPLYLTFVENGVYVIIHTAVVSGITITGNAVSPTVSGNSSSFTQVMPALHTGAFGFWLFTAQSGATVSAGNTDTVIDHQPEVVAFGTGLAHNSVGSNAINLSLNLTSASQLWKGLLVTFEPSTGGGGGSGTGTTTQDYTLTDGSITTSDMFNMGSTTITFGAIDYTACDVTSININPFASSSLSWGTFNIPSCILQSFKLLLFGSNGFDSYNITNFVNSSSSTLPFLMFKFMGGALVYINPLTGQLINLPSASSSLVYSVPLFSTSSPIMFDINASSSVIDRIKIPDSMDKAASTIEMALFFLLWAIIFRYINI